MRTFFALFFLFFFTSSYSAERADSSKSVLNTIATISLNSNGIAPVPAFSLDKPAVMAAVSLSKGRFSYDPMLAYGLDFKPWIIDNWFRYKIVNWRVFELRTGVDVNMFFSESELTEGETILKGQLYITWELAAVYKISPVSNVTLAYWNDRGQDEGTIKGHFLSLSGERGGISAGKHLQFAGYLQLFYINYDGNNDGIFISPKISTSVRKVPFTLFLQAIQPINTNISPYPGFKWNLGLTYTL
jgi:hypothetical protein